MALAVRAAALACLLAVASAYPTLWVEEDALDRCQLHPTKKEGGHPALIADKASTITVTEAGKPVTEACPGTPLKVAVKFAQPRRVLLTASAGAFTTAPDAACPGRVLSTRADEPVSTFEGTLTVPCNATSVDLKVTSATGKTGDLQNLGTKLAVKPAAQCPKADCAALPKLNATAAGNKTANGTLPGAVEEEVVEEVVVEEPAANATAAGAGAPAAAAAAPAPSPAPKSAAAAASAPLALALVASGLLAAALGL